MTECSHDFVVKDGFSEKESYKITVCKTCLQVKNVIPRNEKPKVRTQDDVWAEKDRRMARMSAIKSAVEIKAEATSVEQILLVAEKFLEWIYLP